MKECPKCHATYDDSMNFCVNDGCQLVNKANDNINCSQESSISGNANRKKKNGCLRKIIIAIIVVLVAFFALYQYVMNATSYLRVEPNQSIASKSGGEGKVDIDYDGYVWVINHKPDWVEIDENENDFLIKVEPNRTGQNREGTITIQSGKQLAQVAIRQMGYATVLKTDKNNINFETRGGVEYISIESDGCEWTASFPDWIKIENSDDGEAKITCFRNDKYYRTGLITIKEDNVSSVIYVTQGGKCNFCNGTGEITCSACFGMGGAGYPPFYVQCVWCGGTGKVKCSSCGGSGERE